ncbi:YciI family protein [Paremcibacter congregatus]|uniref:YCII-related domain-containing protein n=1 Tax=Paremcibacter congregatus TaxID=2043170 RepID=A0A2G4YPN6_9PROT|nr:YciI family protein [Paremcibacter congregatus]PHZ84293.1 hypothetical protein CRD36_13100 [Paremcibacter congregatus]QDE25809.1 YciI family protein [Paremcibacter congregatus]
MKYMALIYENEKLSPAPGTDAFNKLIAAFMAAEETFNKDGVYVAGEPLENISSATTVRVRHDKMETTDGPFAETREQLGGFYIFECASLDDALKYAAMIPCAKTGSVEVRPVMSIPGM